MKSFYCLLSLSFVLLFSNYYTLNAQNYNLELLNQDDIELENGEKLLLDIESTSLPSTDHNGHVFIKDSEIGIHNAMVYYLTEIDGNEFLYTATTDINGSYQLNDIVLGDYQIIITAWGYHSILIESYNISEDQNDEEFELELGYYDDFLTDLGWATYGTAETGQWVRVDPNGTFNFDDEPSNPEDDVTDDLGNLCYVTGNADPGLTLGTNDVDSGNVVLESPSFDLSNYGTPFLRYERWFYNGGGEAPINDELVISISNGQETVILEIATMDDSPIAKWISKEFLLTDYIELSDDMRLMVETADGGDNPDGHHVEAGLDHFRITDESITPPEPPTNTAIESTPIDWIQHYPNPVQDVINFEWKTNQLSNVQLSIYNIKGQFISSQAFNQKLSVAVKNLQAGTYFYELSSKDQLIQSGQFVKQ